MYYSILYYCICLLLYYGIRWHGPGKGVAGPPAWRSGTSGRSRAAYRIDTNDVM